MDWEVKWKHRDNDGERVIARNKKSTRASAREWHLVRRSYLKSIGVLVPDYRHDCWEVDWDQTRKDAKVMARNPNSRMRSARKWHPVSTAYLRSVGVSTPTYRADAWEVVWSKRKGKTVWARNLRSAIPSAREWHWIDYHTLNRQGIKWKPVKEHTGRTKTKRGYVVLTRVGMTDIEIALSEKHGLFFAGGSRVLEHRLVALKKYGSIQKYQIVRHVNGDHSDNRPSNLVLGTSKENSLDHKTACLRAIVLRDLVSDIRRDADEAIASLIDSRLEMYSELLGLTDAKQF